jgi:hypothetical protein
MFIKLFSPALKQNSMLADCSVTTKKIQLMHRAAMDELLSENCLFTNTWWSEHELKPTTILVWYHQFQNFTV